MPHQCLKCGELFPDGSTQILRGCPECTGTRFFYTEEALAADERESMLQTTEVDVENILTELGTQESTPEVAHDEAGDWLVAKPEPTNRSPVKAAKPGVTLGFGSKKRRLTKRIHRARTSVRWDYETSEPVAAPALAPKPTPKAPRIDTVEPARPGATDGWSVTAPTSRDHRRVEDVSYHEEAPPAPAPRPSKTVAPSAPTTERPPQRPRDATAPETVHISSPGEYEIDVKRLMEEAPIVVQKDGSYMIHLPSLFESKDSEHDKS